MLGRLDLRPVDEAVAALATAVASGADRLITNNALDFTTDIDEADVTYPDELSEP